MLEPNSLSLAILNGFSGKTIKDSLDALNTFWESIKTYFQLNALVNYSWSGVNPTSGAPDPIVTVIGTIDTSKDPGLIPSKLTDPVSAVSNMLLLINAAASTWLVIFPPALGFILTPSLIIPSIILIPSGLNDPISAQLDLATKLIMGVKMASPATGSHLAFTGVATCVSIL